VELFGLEAGNRKGRRAIKRLMKKYYGVDIGKFRAKDEKYVIWHEDGSVEVIDSKIDDEGGGGNAE
jgi:hypothetical protein